MEKETVSETKRIWVPQGYHEDLTYNQYKNVIVNRAIELQPDFILDEHFEKLIKVLALYFWQDPAFESEGHGKLNKGIFLTGNTGVGKTLMMRLFHLNTRRVMRVVSTNKACDEYQENGIGYLIENYGVPANVHYIPHICFDDLGAERMGVKHMGSELNVMERLIYSRYDVNQHYLTHFTSNWGASKIEELYGSRVRSRLREMVNFFELSGTDRRK